MLLGFTCKMYLFQKKHFILTFCMLSVTWATAQVPDSLRNVFLDSVTVKSYRHTSAVKSVNMGEFVWNVPMLNKLPQILGNADPIHYTQMLPGVQTNSEYKSGINIHGCENSHNGILINDVPIYNTNHLLGFFSVFNANHFSEIRVKKSFSASAGLNRIGGILNLLQEEKVSNDLEFDLSLGLISSQGTIKVPITSKTSLKFSGRSSYINMLYGRWLSNDDFNLKYSFSDFNFSFLSKISDSHALLVDYYGGRDKGDFRDKSYAANILANWGNQMGALHWDYSSEGLKVRNSFFSTFYYNEMRLSMPKVQAKLPSNILDLGYKLKISKSKWIIGCDFIYHKINPQRIDIQGLYETAEKDAQSHESTETSVFGEYHYVLNKYYSAKAGCKVNLYNISQKTYFNIEPSLSLGYDDKTRKLSLNYSLGHQYLFQTGFSDVGLPTEFWISANKMNPPQYAHSFTVNSSYSFLRNRYNVSVDLFYKKLYNQIEYFGSILDVVNQKYSLQQNLLHGKGVNWGFSMLFHKCTGKLSGWFSYTYTKAKRSFAGLGNNYSASHERPHDFKMLLSYNLNKKWDLGATFVYASGTPFTAPESFSLVNNNILINYGEYNACRLKPYMRLDWSINYKFKSNTFKEHGINLSVYNTLCNENELFWKIRVSDDKSFAYRPISFVVDVLPSISYYCKF